MRKLPKRVSLLTKMLKRRTKRIKTFKVFSNKSLKQGVKIFENKAYLKKRHSKFKRKPNGGRMYLSMNPFIINYNLLRRIQDIKNRHSFYKKKTQISKFKFNFKTNKINVNNEFEEAIKIDDNNLDGISNSIDRNNNINNF